MSLGYPLALWGLALIPVLVLLERWRRRPRPRVWPSLLLWRAIAEADAPARRRVESLLLLECAAVLLLSLAGAEPALDAGRRARTVVILIDNGPHMEARRTDGSTAREATLAEVRRLEEALHEDDVVHRFESADLGRGLPEADLKVIATSRAGVGGPGVVVIGRAPDGDNLGIAAVVGNGSKVWFALRTDGEARTVRVRVGDRRLSVRTGEGVEVDRGTPIEILDRDNYDGDDRCEVKPATLLARNETGSRFIDAALAVGIAVAPGDDLVVTSGGGEVIPGLVRGADCVIAPGILDSLFLDQCAWRGVHRREGPGLLTHRGSAIVKWLDERTLWLGIPVDREWDDQGTLPVLIRRAKRQRLEALHGRVAGDAVLRPAPAFVDTKGVDRPWDGTLPAARREVEGKTLLRALLAGLAALVLALYARAMLRS